MGRPPVRSNSLAVALKNAMRRALGGGLPGQLTVHLRTNVFSDLDVTSGMGAMAVQVFALMWLRTVMNFQYRYGHTMKEAIVLLYREGGVARFYQGLLWALIQGPLSRFGDTAANDGTLALLNSFETTSKLPLAMQTAFASVVAGLCRIGLMPVDTVKTIMQVEGQDGMNALFAKAHKDGLGVFFHGAMASAIATTVGHYPWFLTYNSLNAYLPKAPHSLMLRLLRSAFIGLVAGGVSDIVSNSVRVVKTYRQTSKTSISYSEIVQRVLEEEGLYGLLFRGLETRFVAHGLNSIMFAVLWRYFQELYWAKPRKV